MIKYSSTFSCISGSVALGCVSVFGHCVLSLVSAVNWYDVLRCSVWWLYCVWIFYQKINNKKCIEYKINCSNITAYPLDRLQIFIWSHVIEVQEQPRRFSNEQIKSYQTKQSNKKENKPIQSAHCEPRAHVYVRTGPYTSAHQIHSDKTGITNQDVHAPRQNIHLLHYDSQKKVNSRFLESAPKSPKSGFNYGGPYDNTSPIPNPYPINPQKCNAFSTP